MNFFRNTLLNARETVYEKYLADKKWKFVVTLDEAWRFAFGNATGQTDKPGTENVRKVSPKNLWL